MWQYLFLINYKEFQAPQNCSSQPCPAGKCFIMRSKQLFLPFKIQYCIHNYQIYDINGIIKQNADTYYKVYNENSGPLELSLVLPFNKKMLFCNKNNTDDII